MYIVHIQIPDASWMWALGVLGTDAEHWIGSLARGTKDWMN